MKCSLCREVKGLDEFSKAQRRDPDCARCFTCMTGVMETEPGAQIFDNVDEEQKTFFGSDDGSNPFADHLDALSDRESIADDDDDNGVSAHAEFTNHGNGNGNRNGNGNGVDVGSNAESLVNGLESPGHGGGAPTTSQIHGASNATSSMGYPHLGTGLDNLMQVQGNEFIDQLRSVIEPTDDNKSVATEAAVSAMTSSGTSVEGGVKLNQSEWMPRPRQGHGMSSSASILSGHASMMRSKQRVPVQASGAKISRDRQPGLLPYKSNGQSEISGSGFVPTPVKDNIAGQDTGLLFTGYWAGGSIIPETKSSIAGSIVGGAHGISEENRAGEYSSSHDQDSMLTEKNGSSSHGHLPGEKGKVPKTDFDDEESLLGPWPDSTSATKFLASSIKDTVYTGANKDVGDLLNSPIVQGLTGSMKKVTLIDPTKGFDTGSKEIAQEMTKGASSPGSYTGAWAPAPSRRKVVPMQPELRRTGWAKVPAGPKVTTTTPYTEYPPCKPNRNVIDEEDSDDGEDLPSW
ncbi:MAG: hypothetical protein M1829_006670 [Trizodia sp. TS-e1964]|nr:MAG: hypothetical protein M1829_006670 [Trizodia sp. TS-e1964]